MKFMDKLVNAFAVTTFTMLGGMVWGSWYAIVWFSSPVFFSMVLRINSANSACYNIDFLYTSR